jgi:hypothetical protein
VVPSHEVFREPFPVDLRFEDHRVPDNYRHWPGGEKLGPTIKVWKVQTKKFPEIDPGLVSDPYGFDDSPDAEVISSGLNSKGPDSVTLARHGNFFLWGFAASPADMTAGGRSCFLNAVHYIRKFDGRKPLVHRERQARQWALVYAGYLEQFRDNDRLLNQLFSKEILERFGKDPDKYMQYFKENLEYLRPDQPGFSVDEDVKGLGLSNRKVELLDKCVSMLEHDDRPDLARRILGRYTTEHFPGAKGWRTWLEANRGRLFFTDVGGFKWMVAPESLAGSSRLARGPREPDARHPVVSEVEVSPAKVRAGDALTLVVRARTAPTWHIYAVEGSGGPGIATSLTLKLPKGVEAEGDWTCPEATRGEDGQMVYEGSLEFRRRLRVGRGVVAGPLVVSCELGYQACDPRSCRPPAREELKARAEVVEGTQAR